MKPVYHTWLWLVIGVPAILVAGLVATLSQDRLYRAETVQALNLSTNVSIASIDMRRLERLTLSQADLGTDDYERLRAQLDSIETVFRGSGVRGVYVMTKVGDKVAFAVDSAPTTDPWHSEPGTVYKQVSDSVYQTFQDGKARFVGPESDEYGTFYSSLAAIPGTGNRFVIGADIDASAYDLELWTRRLPILLGTLFLAGFFAAAWLIFARRQEKMTIVRHYSRRLETLISELPVGVLILDGKRGFPSMSNPAAMALLGSEVDTGIGAFFFAETYGIEREDGSMMQSEELPINITLTTHRPAAKTGLFIKRADGSRTAIRMSSAPIRDESGRLADIMVVIEDMTKEFSIDKLKSEFISIASHELRTPLTATRWTLESLADEATGPLNEEQGANLMLLQEINVHMIGLVNELLDVSRMETGSVAVSPVLTDMGELLRALLRDLTPLADKKAQRVAYDEIPLPKISIDARLIREVFTNLFSNAVKYTPDGGKITVGTEVDRTFLKISVTDDGIGIPVGQQSEVSNKFFRADNAQENKIEGTGLGLFVTRRAVELSGGTFGFTSEEHRGSTFWFTLPLSGSPRREGPRTLA